MNPFILLAKPLIALGTLVTKMIVAVGFVATEGAEPPKHTGVPPETAIVRVELAPDQKTLSAMEVQLPNGEFYQLAGSAVDPPPVSGGARKPGARTTRSTRSSSGLVATLESETGRSMNCKVSLPHDDESGSGVCTTQEDKKYEFAFDVEPVADYVSAEPK